MYFRSNKKELYTRLRKEKVEKSFNHIGVKTHTAAAVDTPLVAVYGPSSPHFTPPLIDNHIVLTKSEGFDKTREGSEEHGYHESLIAIKPCEVLEGLDRLNK